MRQATLEQMRLRPPSLTSNRFMVRSKLRFAPGVAATMLARPDRPEGHARSFRHQRAVGELDIASMHLEHFPAIHTPFTTSWPVPFTCMSPRKVTRALVKIGTEPGCAETIPERAVRWKLNRRRCGQIHIEGLKAEQYKPFTGHCPGVPGSNSSLPALAWETASHRKKLPVLAPAAADLRCRHRYRRQIRNRSSNAGSVRPGTPAPN